MNNAVFGKTMENVRKHRDIIPILTKPNYYHTTNFFSGNLFAIEMKKTQILMNKSAYLWLSILESSKILMYQFWYDYVKPIYGEKLKLCYTDTDSFILYIKMDDIYKDIAEDVETRFDTSKYELDRSLSKSKNKKVIGLRKDEFSEKIMIKFVGLRAKTYSYLIDDGSEDKKQKTQESVS